MKIQAKARRFRRKCGLERVSEVAAEDDDPGHSFPSKDAKLPENDWNAPNRQQRLRDAVGGHARRTGPQSSCNNGCLHRGHDGLKAIGEDAFDGMADGIC
jgi:hypothetical protein